MAGFVLDNIAAAIIFWTVWTVANECFGWVRKAHRKRSRNHKSDRKAGRQ